MQGEDLETFFIRIEAHNLFFSNVAYQLIGFFYNSQYEFCAVMYYNNLYFIDTQIRLRSPFP